MNTSTSNGCPICGAKSVSRAHVCPPCWLVRCADEAEVIGADRVYAVDPWAAAERFAQQSEFLSGPIVVDVKKPTGGEPIRIEVQVEFVPQYRAVRKAVRA